MAAAVAAATLLLASALCSASAAAKPWLSVVPAWDAFAVAPGERAIELDYPGPFCGSSQRNAHATVRETRADVIVAVSMEEQEPAWAGEPGQAVPPCLPPREATLSVPLSRPLAGRRIRGRSAATLQRGADTFYPRAPGSPEELPRLVGFAPADAEHVLRRLGVSWRVVSDRAGKGHTRVVAQTPSPGRPLAEGRAVKLALRGP